jgi:hypothetical protein
LQSVKYLEDISEEDLNRAIESERSNIHTFLILTKLLFAKKGVPDSEWEDLFHEQKIMQSLRQKGISEYFVKEIVAYLIQARLANDAKIRFFPSFDKQGNLSCSVCPEKPYTVLTVGREDREGSDAIVVVVCKKHMKRIGIKHDLKLIRSITEHCRKQKEELNLVQ